MAKEFARRHDGKGGFQLLDHASNVQLTLYLKDGRMVVTNDVASARWRHAGNPTLTSTPDSQAGTRGFSRWEPGHPPLTSWLSFGGIGL